MNFFQYPKFIPKPSEIPALLPGVVLSIGTALIAFLSISLIPAIAIIGASPIAIFLGIILGNLYFKQPIFQKGTKFSESRLLEYAIVLLGFSVTFETLSHLGFMSALFITLQIAGTITIAIIIGKLLKFSQSYYLLMAAGNAVCGSSAIAAVAPVIKAKEEERGLMITIVNLMGTIMMFLLPLIAIVFYDSKLHQGAFIGGILQSVGQVIASASMLGDEVVRNATIFKIMRIASLVVIVLLFHHLAQKSQNADQCQNHNTAQPNNRTKAEKPKLLTLVPWYLFGFILACALNSLSLLSEGITLALLSISHAFETIALAAIGLRLNFALLKQQGGKLAIYALCMGTGQIVLALLLITLFLN